MKIFSGTANKPLAEKIAVALRLSLSPLDIFTFPDGEKRVRVIDRVVDETCIVVQPTSPPATDNYMELFFIIDALKRSGASQVIVIMPYVGYQRQDHVFRSGEAVSIAVVAHALEKSGASKVIALDLHSIKIPEMFTIPFVHLSALPLFASVIANEERVKQSHDKKILVSPDMGGLRRIKKISSLLNNMPWVATEKHRDLETGSIEMASIEGEGKDLDLSGRHAFIVDDMISSGGTMIKSAELLKKHGVAQVSVFATHAIFSKESPTLLQESALDAVYVTDSVFIPKEKKFEKLHVLSIAEMIAKEI